jgi:hypothetical protein
MRCGTETAPQPNELDPRFPLDSYHERNLSGTQHRTPMRQSIYYLTFSRQTCRAKSWVTAVDDLAETYQHGGKQPLSHRIGQTAGAAVSNLRSC